MRTSPGPAFPAAIGLLGLLAGSVSCGRTTGPLPVLNRVPDFALTAQDGGEYVSTARLKGNIWVADFIFTTCTGPCPRMSRQMKQVQDAVAGFPDVRLVSFTVDPDNDTPPALRHYARRYGADESRWSFLTGDGGTLHKLKREAFLLGDVMGSSDHSTRFVLVDRQGRIRKYYGTTEGGVVRALVADIGALRQEPS